MRIEEYLAVLAEDGAQLADKAQNSLDAPTPTCPGWRTRDVVAHTGGVHRWAASIVAAGREGPYPQDQEDAFFPEIDDEALVGWFREGHQALVATLANADPERPCWTFMRSAPTPVTFWARRQAHETAIHRYDAGSTEPTWTPEFAADGLDELLNGFFERPGKGLPAEPPATIAIAATDADAAWTIRFGPEGHRTEPGAQPADLTVTGPATDLYLLLWNRIALDRLASKGNETLWSHWRDRAKVTW
jgi:uncharacterized protein (TIGR03083 family)